MTTGLLLAGCVPSSQSPASPPQTFRLSEADNGRAVELRPGDSLEVTLPANPSTGFAWQADSAVRPVLEALGEPQFSPDSGAVGAGGRTLLRYRAAQTGQAQLSLVYRRSFENQPPARTFSARVTVR